MRTFCNNKGISLIVLIVIMLGIGLIGGGVATIMSSKQKSYPFAVNSYRAYEIANAGAECTIAWVQDTSNANRGLLTSVNNLTNVSFGGGTFSTVISGTSPNEILTSTGTFNNVSRVVTVIDFSSYVVTTPSGLTIEEILIYGQELNFSGSTISGDNATIIIRDGLQTSDLGGGSSVAVSNIYIGGDVVLNGGSASLGSPTQPGAIYINGDLELWRGARHVYGDVYVNGNFRLKDARIHGNVYVNGNVELGWTPTLDENSRIYYTGTLTYPNGYPESILAKCIWQATVPGFTMPAIEIPTERSTAWYSSKGYTLVPPSPSPTLTSNLKLYAGSNYTSTTHGNSYNVTIVSMGNITLTKGGTNVSGVLFAPYGKVTFSGTSFTGTVIARDGFFVTSGGTTVTYQKISDFIGNPNDYPFIVN